MKKSYIVYHPKHGIFCDLIFFEDGRRHPIVIFSNDHTNQYAPNNAMTFSTELEATNYIVKNFQQDFSNELVIHTLPKDYNGRIEYIDLLKNGMKDYTGYMINSMTMENVTLH